MAGRGPESAGSISARSCAPSAASQLASRASRAARCFSLPRGCLAGRVGRSRRSTYGRKWSAYVVMTVGHVALPATPDSGWKPHVASLERSSGAQLSEGEQASIVATCAACAYQCRTTASDSPLL
eukprot:4109959-Prymnesium_polylepis.1